MGRFGAFVLVLVIHNSATECPPVGRTTILGQRSTFGRSSTGGRNYEVKGAVVNFRDSPFFWSQVPLFCDR